MKTEKTKIVEPLECACAVLINFSHVILHHIGSFFGTHIVKEINPVYFSDSSRSGGR